MQLPHSDELNIGHLSRLFDNTTNCYKFFWFQAILRKLDGKNNRFSFDELINEMIADAWYMVTEYHLRLGPLGITDNLEEVVKYIHNGYGFMSSEKREKIIAFLQTTDDKSIAKYKADLTLNVPYRLQVPFYDEIKIERTMWNGSKKNLTDEINRQRRLIYYFDLIGGLDTRIEINSLWSEYLFKHKEILRGWAQLKLIQYLQNKNPSVPGIADKIEAPASRDIERVRKYWKIIVQIDSSLRDIYGDVFLADEIISVDHFVPWQYVAHDELWNLHPTTKSINSSKSNSLPSWDMYFRSLGDIEYRAYELKAKNDIVAREFNKIALYHLNNQEIRNQLYSDGLNRNAFIERLEHIIKPVYESAQTLGFKEWIYNGCSNTQ
ncbi:HNH endonuclease domain-containing protein [Butyrivibrio sp. AE2005]|uniref:HNH endonuclease domain-containing protein n=1 Tax=Butyrivibrio sp. AE2005 TaxID=1496722 RepID=UPI00047C4A73|nr:HNH endonuclease domain-containing protein [Butyrivibrio sp. AE2005]